VGMVARPCYAVTAQVVNIAEESVLDAIIGGQTVVKAEARAGAILLGDVIDKTVRLTVGPSKLKVLGRVALQAGLIGGTLLLGQEMEDWLNDIGWSVGQGGVIQGPGSGYTSQYAGQSSWTNGAYGYVTVIKAPEFWPAGIYDVQSDGSAPGGHGWSSTYWRNVVTNCYSNSCYGFTLPGGKTSGAIYAMYPKSASYVTAANETKTDAQIETALEDAFEAGERSGMARELGKYFAAQHNAMRENWPYSDTSVSGLTAQQQTDIKNAIDGAISATDKAELEDVNQTVPEPSADVQKVNIVAQDGKPLKVEVVNQSEGFTDAEYTPEQMAEGAEAVVSEAYTAAGGGSGMGENGGPPSGWEPTIPEDPEEPTPEDIPDFLDWWWTSIASLPIISAISDYLETETATVVSQDAVVTLAKPEWLGGPVEVDFSTQDALLTFMGHGLYSLVGIRMMWWLMGKKE